MARPLTSDVKILQRIQSIREKRAKRLLNEARAIVAERDAEREAAKINLDDAISEEESRIQKVKSRARTGKITASQLVANSCFAAMAKPAVIKAEKGLDIAIEMLMRSIAKEGEARVDYSAECNKVKKIDQLKQRAKKASALEIEIRTEDEADEFSVNKFASKRSGSAA
jgi:hypothetical protein